MARSVEIETAGQTAPDEELKNRVSLLETIRYNPALLIVAKNLPDHQFLLDAPDRSLKLKQKGMSFKLEFQHGRKIPIKGQLQPVHFLLMTMHDTQGKEIATRGIIVDQNIEHIMGVCANPNDPKDVYIADNPILYQRTVNMMRKVSEISSELESSNPKPVSIANRTRKKYHSPLEALGGKYSKEYSRGMELLAPILLMSARRYGNH